MSIGEHLDELRRRLFWSVGYWIAFSLLAGYYADLVMEWVLTPFMEALEKSGQPAEVIYIGPTDSFTVVFKVILITGAFLASPFIAREAWGFVAAGLYGREKRLVTLAAPLSFLLFAGGALFFYVWVLPPAVDFLYNYGRDFFPGRPEWMVVQKPNIPDAVSFFLWMSFAMGLVFQLPLVMYFLSRLGMVRARTFARFQRHFILGATVVAAIITPTGDAVTLSFFMLPILALFYLGLLAVWLRERGDAEGAS